MKERLQKIIAAHGLMSRRAAELAITEGRVRVNGITAELGGKADAGLDVVEVDGKPLLKRDGFVYIMLHKPRGVVTTMSDERGRPDVTSLVSSVGARVLPVGRLDMNSEGLLLMTNDNQLIHKLTHPSHQVDKTYHVWTRRKSGMPLSDILSAMSRPMVIEGRQITPATVECLSSQGELLTLSVVIHEGRKRQVRQMCAQSGLTVLRLMRVSEGPLSLGTLKPGSWRFLTPAEIRLLNNPDKRE